MTAEYVDPWAVDYPARVALAVSLLGTHRCAFPSCARVIAETVAMLTDQVGVSRPENGGEVLPTRDTRGSTEKASRRAAGNSATALTTALTKPGTEADMSILAHQPEHTPTEPTADDPRVARMRGLVDKLVRQRDALRAENNELAKRAVHWYVDDGQGYCLACGTTRPNLRHRARAA